MTGVDGVGDDTRRHLTHVARGGALGLVGAGVSAVAGFALVVIVTNYVTVDTAGLFFTATSAFLLLLAVATLGTETGLARFLLRYEAQDRRGDIRPTVRAAFRPTLTFSVVVAALVIVFADPLADLIGLDGQDAPASLRLLAVVLPLATWNAITLAGTRAFGQMRATVMVDKIARPVAQTVLVLVIAVASADLLGLTVAWAVPYAVAAIASAWMFHRFLQRRGTFEHTVPTKSYQELRREFWQFTWPRGITRISQVAIQRMDIILIAALRSPKEAAIYTAATRFVVLGQFGAQAIQQVVQPKFTALLAHHEDEALKDVYQISTAWSMAISWPLYVGVGAAPLVYLGLFGEEYADNGLPVVVLMSIAMLFAVATGPVDTLLLMAGRSGLSLANALLALAVDLVLCVVLIPPMGITGAAIAWAVAVTLRCTLALIQVRMTLSLVSFGPAAAIVALANLVCFGLPLLPGLFGDVGVVPVLLALAACVPAYVLTLWLGRKVLMLDVLRSLVRRAPAEPAAEPVEVTDSDA
jgi:O-antigen/teichoic acid export membrane protein